MQIRKAENEPEKMCQMRWLTFRKAKQQSAKLQFETEKSSELVLQSHP